MKVYKMSLKIENLGLGYDGQMLFTGLVGNVEMGESLAILGCNGTGKSSLLRVIAGINPPNFGAININEFIDNIAYLPQNPNIRRDIPISVFEYVKFAELSGKKPSKEQSKNIFELLGLNSIKNDFLTNISGGQLVFASLARIALSNAKIIILDEPFASLDKDAAKIFLNLIKIWKSEGRIIIISIHDDRLAQDFDHFLTLDGKNAFWEKNCPNHSENCILSHDHNHFHNHILDAAQ